MSLSILFPLQGSHYTQPSLKQGELHSIPPWGWSIFINCLEFFLPDLPLLPHVFSHLSVSVWTHGNLFYTLLYLSIYLSIYLSSILNCSSFGHWELFQLTPVSFWRSPITVCIHVDLLTWGGETLPYFLALQDVPGSSCIFPSPDLDLAISWRSPDSLYYRTVLETSYLRDRCPLFFANEGTEYFKQCNLNA